MTKNTKVWIRGIIATVVNGFASGIVLLVADPVAFNLDTGLGKLLATSGIFALLGLANYLKQHPLPDDEDIITLRSWALPLFLVGAVAAMSCGALRAPVTPTPSEAQVQATRAQALQIAQAVEQAGAAVVQAGRLTAQAYDARVISKDQRDVVLNAIIALEPRAHAVIDVAASVTTDPQLRTTVAAFMSLADPLIAALTNSGHPELAKAAETLRTGYALVSAYLGGGR
jgi:hypothetical protein